MGQAGTKVIPLGSQKYLRLVVHTAKGFGVEDAVAVALIGGAYFAFRFFFVSSFCIAAEGCVGA